MDLNHVASLAEIVNALAVTLTLVGLIVTIRQSTRIQKALAVDSLSAAISAINVPALESPALGSAVSRAVSDWGSATRDERILAHFFLYSIFKLWENAWYQHRAGILDTEQWQGWERLARRYYHSPGVREVWWPARGNSYSAAFQSFLAASEPPPEVANLNDIFDCQPKRS